MKIEVIGARGKYTGDLLSAAPDLLDACRSALAQLQELSEANCFSLSDPAHITIKRLRTAINKATGEAI
jgi:hypothetical protein